MDKRILYHYCSTNAFFNIINSSSFRMSDIVLSNDYMELKSLYPIVARQFIEIYKLHPFEFMYMDRKGLDAIYHIIDETLSLIQEGFRKGDLKAYAICFSEEGDLLSQWRGYGDDLSGISLGVSLKTLDEFVKNNKKFLVLTKVNYLSDKDLIDIANDIALKFYDNASKLREFVIDEMNAIGKDIDGLMGFNFHGMFESIIFDNIQYKHESFKEENEWRLFAKSITEMNFSKGFDFMKNYGLLNKLAIQEIDKRINFFPFENRIKSYLKLDFSELLKSGKLIEKVILGSKNTTTIRDLDLFLYKNDIAEVEIENSIITFR